jgi:hypothetical protein
MNLWQKIIEVRKSVNSLTKDVDKDGLKYTYVSGNQILGKIKAMMDEKGIILQPSIELGSHEQYDYTTQYGKEMTDFIVKGEMSYTWINAEKPEEREIVRWAYYGQQSDISKALGSGLTYSERYFLLKYFGLPTDEDDPDLNQDDKKGKTKEKKKYDDKKDELGDKLIDLISKKGATVKGILDKYKEETGKFASEIKFMKSDKKQEFIDRLEILPDKQ